MKLFLAWSGGRSYELAKALGSCIREVCPDGAVKYFLSSGIEPGMQWFDAVDQALKESDAVLLCITRDNVRSPWMHFEVGSRLGTDKDSRVFTYLLDAKPDELTDALRRYQAADCTKEGTLSLLETLSRAPGDTLSDRFEGYWPKLEHKILQLKCFSIEELVPGFERLFQRKTFHEPMAECADQYWLDRYYGARQTLDKLNTIRDAIDTRWQPYQASLIRELINTVDAYVREMRRFLITEVQFRRGPDGKLDLSTPEESPNTRPSGDPRWSDKRCETIRELVSQLLDPDGAPVLSESLFFTSLGPFWRKKVFVHRREAEIESRDFALKKHELLPCAGSCWDFDRIVFYLSQEYVGDPAFGPDRLIKQVERELERLQAQLGAASAMPLHYSIRALLSSVKRGTPDEPFRKQTRSLADEILTFLKQQNLDRRGQMQRKLEELISVTSAKIDSVGA
jgi:hypothetical protein